MIKSLIVDTNWVHHLVFFILILTLFFISCFLLKRDFKKKENEISNESIREGLNKMSAGLCFYENSGQPILMNDHMENLCQSLFKTSLLNGNEFWEALEKNENIYGKRVHATYPTYILNNGKVFSFTKQEFNLGKDKINQLLASDVTPLFQISNQIDENNKALAKVNIRLQDYSQNVSALTRDEEILSAKIRVHDDLGHSIIATKYYLSDPKSTIDKEQLVKMWKTNISLLRKEEVHSDNDNVLMYLYDAAKAIGLQLVIEGNVSNWDVASKRLLTISVRECMTNAIQHAKATKLFVRIQKNSDVYCIRFENNGSNPKRIIEGGGLSSLRKQVEKANGEMTIECEPQFYLEIKIPRKDDGNV